MTIKGRKGEETKVERDEEYTKVDFDKLRKVRGECARAVASALALL